MFETSKLVKLSLSIILLASTGALAEKRCTIAFNSLKQQLSFNQFGALGGSACASIKGGAKFLAVDKGAQVIRCSLPDTAPKTGPATVGTSPATFTC
ncbi:hypothetical protein PspLS_09308 [Pyricularia sp. CBS 133598]|nr:hypothetical protein PspLS_09308 [Pyricularia sp. CBS 133598]